MQKKSYARNHSYVNTALLRRKYGDKISAQRQEEYLKTQMVTKTVTIHDFNEKRANQLTPLSSSLF